MQFLCIVQKIDFVCVHVGECRSFACMHNVNDGRLAKLTEMNLCVTFLQIDSRISSWRKSISIFVRKSSRTRPQVERVIPSSPPTLTLTEFFIGWRSMIFCFSAENGGKKRPKIREKLRPNDGVGGGENVRDKKYFFYFVLFLRQTQMPERIHSMMEATEIGWKMKDGLGFDGDFHSVCEDSWLLRPTSSYGKKMRRSDSEKCLSAENLRWWKLIIMIIYSLFMRCQHVS